MKIEWSSEAVADLERFAGFLQERHPQLARIVGPEIARRVTMLGQHPLMGRPIAEREEYRQVALRVLNAVYVFQYRIDGERIVIMRVFHAREQRDSPA